MMALVKMLLFSFVLITSLGTRCDCQGIFRRLLQVSTTASVPSSVFSIGRNLSGLQSRPPVDSGIIEGETDERRWHLRQLDLLMAKSTIEPLQRLGEENETTGLRKQVSASALSLEPASASHRRFPVFDPAAVVPRTLHSQPRVIVPPLAADFIQEGESGSSRGRYGVHRSLDSFPPLLNQPGQDYLDAINRRTVWPGITTTTTYRPVTEIPTTPAKPVLTSTTADYKWLSVTTQSSSTVKLEEPSPPIVLTTKYNDTTIGTAFSLSEDLTDAHLTMEMFTSPNSNVTNHPTTEAMSTVSTTTIVTTTNSPTISPVTVLTTSHVAVTQQPTTVKPVTPSNQTTGTTKPELSLQTEFILNKTMNEPQQAVVEELNSTTAKQDLPVNMKGLPAQSNDKIETSTTILLNKTLADTTTATVQANANISSTTAVETTPVPIVTTIPTTVGKDLTTKPTLLSTTVTVAPLIQRRLPNFRSNPRQTLRQRLPSPPKVATTTLLPIILIPEDEEEDYYVPTLPPMEPTPTKQEHVITVPPMDDGFVVVFDEDHVDEAEEDSLDSTSLSDEEKRLIPEGAKDAILISIVIGGCAVVFFAGVMIFCMLRNRRTIYRAPDSSASSSNSSSPFQTKLG